MGASECEDRRHKLSSSSHDREGAPDVQYFQDLVYAISSIERISVPIKEIIIVIQTLLMQQKKGL